MVMELCSAVLCRISHGMGCYGLRFFYLLTISFKIFLALVFDADATLGVLGR